MATNEKIKYPLFRKIFLGVVWFVIMWVGQHTSWPISTSVFGRGCMRENPAAGGRAGVAVRPRRTVIVIVR